MKKLQLFTIFFLVTSAITFTQVHAQNTDNAAGFSALQNSPNPFTESTSIKFDLVKDSYVRIFIVNLQTGNETLLIDGEMSAGMQGVIFKANNRPGKGNVNYRCVLEIYSLNANMLLNITEIKMIQK